MAPLRIARILRALLLITVAWLASACRAALSAPFTPPEAGGATWVEVSSAHFQLHSDADPADARGAVEALERMYATLLEVGFPYAAKPAQRVRVILFRREAEYKPVAPFGSAGFFSRAWLDGDGIEPVAVLHGDLTNKTREVLQHELTHRFVRFYYPKASAWLHEGLAHYFETLEVDGGYAVLGKPAFVFHRGPGWRDGFIPVTAGVAAHDVLAMHKGDLDPDPAASRTPEDEMKERRRVVANRASAWALVHLLATGPENYRKGFSRFLETLGRGEDTDAAWFAAFGSVNPSLLDADLEASLAPAGREIPILRTAYAPPAPKIEGERPMAPADVHLLWSALKGRDRAAEVDAALGLAPESPAVWRAKARVLVHDGSFAEAEQALQKALTLAPDDRRTLYLLFGLYADRAGKRNAPPVWRQRAEALVPKLVPLAASSPVVTNALAWNLGLWGRIDEALPLSLKSVEIDPSCWECYDTLASLLAQKGAPAKALEAQRLAVDLMPDGVSDPGAIRRLRQYQAAAKAAKAAPPVAPAGAAAPEGGIPAAVVRTIAKRRSAGYQRCYDEGLARDPKLQGKVSVRLVVEPDGAVSHVADDGSTLADKQVVACVAAELRQLRFPPREGGAAETVGHAISFAPPAEPAKP